MKTIHHLILFLLLVLFIGCSNVSDEKFVAVNLVGYKTDSPKQAYLVNSTADRFDIVRTDNSEVVFSDSLVITKKADSITGDELSLIDFSDFNGNGEFIIKTAGTDQIISHPFRIEENVYGEALKTVIKSFYYHRCGTQVGIGEEWSYNICHLDDAPFYDVPEKSKQVTGGWHDAGDYNKFTVNTALSAGLLLYAYEMNPANFPDDQLGIPESGNGIPDLLDEVSYALEWLMKMQRKDGAVYHKVSQKKWMGEYLPHQDPSTRYIFEISSAATASFAAVSALGSRHLADFNPALSQKLTDAAIKAWNYLEEHPENQPEGGFKNPDDVTGGEYGDPSDLDERLWASMELYKLTNNKNCLEFFIQNYHKLNPGTISPISWRDAESLAFQAFLSADTQGNYSEDREAVRDKIIRHADSVLEVQKKNNYSNLIRYNQYYWGSNSVGLAYAFDLIQAYGITKNAKYKYAALDQLHYVLGRNPFNLSQVTGVGSASVQNPYHQLSETGNFSAPVPGMLVGGPNNRLLLNNKEISPYPGKNYEDTFKNYLVNEPAINYTAITAFVISAFTTSENETNTITESQKLKF